MTNQEHIQTQNKINIIETALANMERTKLQAETKVEGFRMQFKGFNDELRAHGVDPKQVKEYLEELELAINKDTQELLNAIPKEFLPSEM